jgi:hypothetical protein
MTVTGLVITGRSRLALYLARIPAGLFILLSLAAAGFTVACLVIAFLGGPPPTGGIRIGPGGGPAGPRIPPMPTWR